MSRADIHIHTIYSDGICSVEKVLSIAQKKGLSVIAITDHNVIDGALEAREKSAQFGVEVILGEEVSSTKGHILGLFLKNPIARGLEPKEVIRQIHEQGGLAIISHPDVRFPHGMGEEELSQILKSPASKPDGVEVANGFPWQFRRKGRLLEKNKDWGLAVTGGSDSHGPNSVGCCYTEFEGNTAQDLRQAIISKSTNFGGSAWPISETVRALLRDLLYRGRKIFRG